MGLPGTLPPEGGRLPPETPALPDAAAWRLLIPVSSRPLVPTPHVPALWAPCCTRRRCWARGRVWLLHKLGLEGWHQPPPPRGFSEAGRRVQVLSPQSTSAVPPGSLQSLCFGDTSEPKNLNLTRLPRGPAGGLGSALQGALDATKANGADGATPGGERLCTEERRGRLGVWCRISPPALRGEAEKRAQGFTGCARPGVGNHIWPVPRASSQMLFGQRPAGTAPGAGRESHGVTQSHTEPHGVMGVGFAKARPSRERRTNREGTRE